MNRIGRCAAVGLLGALAAFTVVLAADPDELDAQDRARLEAESKSAGIAAATSAGCTVATADRSSSAVSDCTSCHSGLGSGGRRNMMQMPGHDFGHPVDVDFDAARSASPDSFLSRDKLPAFLPLADGKITCLTCHDGRAGNRHALAKASQKEMCLACHRM